MSRSGLVYHAHWCQYHMNSEEMNHYLNEIFTARSQLFNQYHMIEIKDMSAKQQENTQIIALNIYKKIGCGLGIF